MNIDEKIQMSRSEESIDISNMKSADQKDPLVKVESSSDILVEPNWTLENDDMKRLYAKHPKLAEDIANSIAEETKNRKTEDLFPYDPHKWVLPLHPFLSPFSPRLKRNKLFDFGLKKLIVISLFALGFLGAVFAILVFTNIVALNEFKALKYTNSNGTTYKMDFYTKHSSKQLKSGNTQLVSKVSKYGKFPIGLSISTGGSSALNKNGIKTCSGPWPKAMDVQNNNINQTIAVCYIPQKDGPVGVYIAGFEYNNQAHIVIISEDLAGLDLSSQSAAKDSLTKFGIEPYKSDIERIVSSIVVE